MSKFQEALRVFHLRGKRVALPESLTVIEVEQDFNARMPTATLYTVRVEVGGTCMIEDLGPNTAQAVDYQTKMMKHAIAHEIYGDVYATLREMYPLLAKVKMLAVRDLRAYEAVQGLERKVQAIHDAITPT